MRTITIEIFPANDDPFLMELMTGGTDGTALRRAHFAAMSMGYEDGFYGIFGEENPCYRLDTPPSLQY